MEGCSSAYRNDGTVSAGVLHNISLDKGPTEGSQAPFGVEAIGRDRAREEAAAVETTGHSVIVGKGQLARLRALERQIELNVGRIGSLITPASACTRARERE